MVRFKRLRSRLCEILAIGVLASSSVSAVYAETLVIPDTGGHDQIDQGNGAQQDIAGVIINGNVLDFAWDEPSLSGSNSSDVCSYFLEPDGDVTSVCYSVEFVDPAIPSYEKSFRILDCGTTYGNGKCTGNNPVSVDYSATCEDPSLVAPYFAPDDTDPDLQAQCTILDSSGNAPTDLQYINTCTKPSGSPSSLSNDCIFDPDSDPAFLSLEKVVSDGTAVPTNFLLTATNNNGSSESISGAGEVSTSPVNAGTYSLTETSTLINDGSYTLENLACTDSNGDDVSVTGGSVTLGELQTVTCVYTNKLAVNADQSGTITKESNVTEFTMAGDEIDYTVTVVNTGNVAFKPVVTDELNETVLTLTGPDGDTNDNEELDTDETWVYTAKYIVTQDDIESGKDLTNIACADLNGDGMDECSTTIATPNPTEAVAIEKTTDTEFYSAAGQIIKYTVKVTNDGTISMVPNVSDQLNDSGLLLSGPSGDTDGDDRLDVLETWEYTASYTVTQDDLDNRTVLSNVACVNGVVACSAAVSNPLIKPDAEVSKSADKDEVSAADTVINYEVRVKNTGNITLDPIALEDQINGTLDIALTYYSGDSDTGNVDKIDVGEIWVYKGSYKVTQEDMDSGAPLVNVVCIGDIDDNKATDDDECANASTAIKQLPAQTLKKDFNPDQVEIGQSGSFTLVYTNTGNVTLRDVQIADEVASILSVSTVEIVSVGTCELASQSIDCSVDSLAPDEGVTVMVDFDAAKGAADNTTQTAGASFVFYFENGYTLRGMTSTVVEATLIDPDGNESMATVDGAKQDIVFYTPDGQVFTMHLSCSEPFIDGYGAVGPTEADNPEWKISVYDVNRYNKRGFLKSCNQAFVPFSVNNTASAKAIPAGGELTPNPIEASDSVELTQPSPIEVSRTRVRRGAVAIQYFNTSQEAVEISMIEVSWTDSAVLENAFYANGVDLELSGDSLQSKTVSSMLPARSKRWLTLDFGSNDVPTGLMVTIGLSTGQRMTYVY